MSQEKFDTTQSDPNSSDATWSDPTWSDPKWMEGATLHTAEVLYQGPGRDLAHDVGVVVDNQGTVREINAINSFSGSSFKRYDHQVLLPGFVNCHVHLTDAGITSPLPGGHGLIPWVGELLAARGRQPDEEISTDAVATNLPRHLAAMIASGTVAIGEVVNNYATISAIESSSQLSCRFIHELIGFQPERAQGIMEQAIADRDARGWEGKVKHSFAIHAPYSVSLPLAERIVAENRRHHSPTFVHLAEDPEERHLYADATGAWPPLLRSLGVWNENWSGSGASPIERYAELGLIDASFVAVHLANARADELKLFGRCQGRAILSPASNLHITGLLPDVEALVASDVPFGFGTDGGGSNISIDVLDEARIVAERWPDLAPGAILAGLTSTGAEILDLEWLGTIDIGKRPGLVGFETSIRVQSKGEIERALLFESTSHHRVA